jgi:hypothetical protein
MSRNKLNLDKLNRLLFSANLFYPNNGSILVENIEVESMLQLQF